MQGAAEREIESVLDRQIEAARSLETTLAAERAALVGTCAATVVEQARQKTDLFHLLEELDGRRRELCAAAAIDPAMPERGAQPIGERWRALLELIARCRTANEVNGYIINTRRVQLGQLFEVLRGGRSATYGPEGRTFATSLRALARA